jgi:Delta7-sterol 5-desaturase
VTFDPALRWFDRLNLAQAIPLFLLQNALLFAGTVVFGNAISRRWSHRRIAAEVQGDRRGEMMLGLVAIVMNTIVTIVGWWLWQRGMIRLTGKVSFAVIGEVIAFTLVLDGLMYLGHRIGHHPTFYPTIHRYHHRFVEPRAATLFALHPVEAVGFGFLWIAALVITSAVGYTVSGFAVGVFTSINLVFGVLGHVGVDPLPDRVRSSRLFRWIATPGFHVGHHLNPTYNHGFFTTWWDRVFDSIDPEYDAARLKPLIPIHT